VSTNILLFIAGGTHIFAASQQSWLGCRLDDKGASAELQGVTRMEILLSIFNDPYHAWYLSPFLWIAGLVVIEILSSGYRLRRVPPQSSFVDYEDRRLQFDTQGTASVTPLPKTRLQSEWHITRKRTGTAGKAARRVLGGCSI